VRTDKIDDLLTLVDRRIDTARAQVSTYQAEMKTNDAAMRIAEQKVRELGQQQRAQLLAKPVNCSSDSSLNAAAPDLNISRINYLKCVQAKQREVQRLAAEAKEQAHARKLVALEEMTAESHRKDVYADLRKTVVKQAQNLEQNKEDEATSEIFLSRVARNR
jgi:hypothetical protein